MTSAAPASDSQPTVDRSPEPAGTRRGKNRSWSAEIPLPAATKHIIVAAVKNTPKNTLFELTRSEAHMIRGHAEIRIGKRVIDH